MPTPEREAARLRQMSTPAFLAAVEKIVSGLSMHDEVRGALMVASERLAAVDRDSDEAEATTPVATTTVEHAKLFLRAHMGEGTDCPVCGRFTRMYRRNISGHMAKGLLAQYQAAGTQVVDTRGVWPASTTGGPNVSLLRFWHLIEPGEEARTWRVTDLGANWIAGRATVLSHALIFDNRCFGIEGEPVRFADVVGEPFDLDKLMADHAFPPPSDESPRLFE